MSLFPLTVVIAAINEEEGIGPTICELKKILNEPHLLVVDGKSSDKTIEIAKAVSYTHLTLPTILLV